MKPRSFSATVALALIVSSGAIAQTAAAPHTPPANPAEKQGRDSRNDFVGRAPGSGREQFTNLIARPGTHEAGLALRMLSVTNGKVALQPEILQALDLAWTD